MIQRSDIAGVVLAGGRSRRFGSDKAFACLRGRMLIDHALDSIAPSCGELIVATGRPEMFQGTSRAAIVRDKVSDLGPLGGIVSAMHSTAKEWFLILACDIMASASAIDALVRAGGEDACIALVDGRPQYLCGIYSKKILARFEECLERGIFPMKNALSSVSGVTFTAVPLTSVSNINTQEDLVAYEERAARHVL